MNYRIIYNNLITQALNQTIDENIYYEMHHIKPRCLDGGDDPSNLVKLTFKQHYFAHLILNRISPNNVQLSMALLLMSGRYNSMRQAVASRLRGRFKQSQAIKDAHARNRGYVDYNHIIYDIWSFRTEDGIFSVQDISQIINMPIAYIQRCLNYYANEYNAAHVLRRAQFLEKSNISRMRILNETPEARKIRTQNANKTKRTKKYRNRISNARMGGNNPHAKRVLYNGKEYESISEATRLTNLPYYIVRRRSVIL